MFFGIMYIFNKMGRVVTSVYVLKRLNILLMAFLICIFLNNFLLSEVTQAMDYSIKVLSPDGGETIPAGSTYIVRWWAGPDVSRFKVKYSLNGGRTWKLAGVVEGATSFSWQVPVIRKNKPFSLIKVVGFDSSGKYVSKDESDRPFRVEVLRITKPGRCEVLTSGTTYTVKWESYGINAADVASTEVWHTINGGVRWELDTEVAGYASSYDWTVPVVKKGKTHARVKVIMRDETGRILGEDVSNGTFVIDPYNTAPTITTTSLPNATEGQPYSATVSCNNPDGPAPTLSASGLPSYLQATDNRDGTMTISLNNNYTEVPYDAVIHPDTQRTDNITITCEDGKAQVQKTLPLVTDDVNRPPYFTTQPPSQTVYQRGDVYYYDADGFDPDGDTPMFDATNIPPGVIFDPASGVFDGDLLQTGNYNIEITIMMDMGALRFNTTA